MKIFQKADITINAINLKPNKIVGSKFDEANPKPVRKLC